MLIQFAMWAPSGRELMCHSIVAVTLDGRVYTQRYAVRICAPQLLNTQS
jgi:hypothetical protein